MTAALPPGLSDMESRRNRYSYHSPTPEGQLRHQRLTDLFIAMEEAVAVIVPVGRELSLVKTHLEEAKMWASAGVARNPDTR